MYFRLLINTMSTMKMTPISTRFVSPQAPWSYNPFAYKYTWSWFAQAKSFHRRISWLFDLIEEERLKLPSQSTKDIYLIGIS